MFLRIPRLVSLTVQLKLMLVYCECFQNVPRCDYRTYFLTIPMQPYSSFVLVNILGIRHVAARLIPKKLNFRHVRSRQFWSHINGTHHNWWRDMDLWVWHANASTVIRMKDKRQTKTEKTTQTHSKVKVMLIVFFDIRGLEHHDPSAPSWENGQRILWPFSDHSLTILWPRIIMAKNGKKTFKALQLWFCG